MSRGGQKISQVVCKTNRGMIEKLVVAVEKLAAVVKKISQNVWKISHAMVEILVAVVEKYAAAWSKI